MDYVHILVENGIITDVFDKEVATCERVLIC